MNKINDIPDMELQFRIDDQLFLETLLLHLRGKTIPYALYKKKQNIDRESILKK